jgi:hypothetical protein
VEPEAPFCQAVQYHIPGDIFILTARRTSYFSLLISISVVELSYKKKLHGLSTRANYIDRATAACWRIVYFCGLRVPRGQRVGSLRPYSRFSRQEPLPSRSIVVLTRLSGPRSRPTTFFLVVPGIELGPLDM